MTMVSSRLDRITPVSIREATDGRLGNSTQQLICVTRTTDLLKPGLYAATAETNRSRYATLTARHGSVHSAGETGSDQYQHKAQV